MYASTAGCTFGSVVGLWLPVGEVDAAAVGDFVAVGTAAWSPPQAAVAETVKVNATAIKFRFIKV